MTHRADGLMRALFRIGLGAVFGFAITSAARAQAPRYLFGRADFSTGPAQEGSASSVVAADFNGDGRLDLAAINSYTSSVAVLLGQADGGFAPHVDYAIPGIGPMAVGDFNGDGKLDLAVGVESAPFELLVFLGNGDGTFGAPIETATNNAPTTLVVDDFNNDGKLDVAAAYEGQSSLAVLLGNGDGAFQPEKDTSTGYEPVALATADFNGDGKLDVAVADYDITPGRVSVLLGNGNGTFQFHQDYTTANGVQSIVVGDFNGDGIADLAATAAAANGVSVLLGKGDGTFNTYMEFPTVASPGQIVTGDFNGDGKLDLAVVSGTAGVGNLGCVLLGQGNGSFQPQIDLSAPGPVTSMVTGDFNRDNKLDLALTANITGARISVLAGNGNGSFPTGETVATASQPISVTAGDFNGDGLPDLAVATGGGTGAPVSILLGTGRGHYKKHVEYPTSLTSPYTVVTADFNGDGALDLAVCGVRSNSADVAVLLGNGDGSFQSPVDYATSANTDPVFLLMADFNNDGIPDLAAVEYPSFSGPSAVGVFIGNGDGTFKPRVDYAVTSFPWAATAGDFNGDGILDLAATNSLADTVSILLGNGDGTFQPKVDYPTGSGPLGIVTADFSGNGKLDLATTDYSGSLFSVLLGNGDGTFQMGGNHYVGVGFAPIVTADLNDDGKPDLVMSQAYSDTFSAFIGAGNGSFGAAITYGTHDSPGEFGPNGLLAADVDGDGTPDVAITNLNGNTVSLLLNIPVAAFSSAALSFGPQAVGTTSAPMALALYDAAVQPLSLRSVKVTGDFAQKNTCPHTLSSGSCQFNIEFRPTQEGTRTGTLVLDDDGPGGSQTIMLTGQGTAGNVIRNKKPGF